jgi:hypothetical protein
MYLGSFLVNIVACLVQVVLDRHSRTKLGLVKLIMKEFFGQWYYLHLRYEFTF